jgi:hypothetical protein
MQKYSGHVHQLQGLDRQTNLPSGAPLVGALSPQWCQLASGWARQAITEQIAAAC